MDTPTYWGFIPSHQLEEREHKRNGKRYLLRGLTPYRPDKAGHWA